MFFFSLCSHRTHILPQTHASDIVLFADAILCAPASLRPAGDPAAKVYLAVGRGAASASGAERSSSMPRQQGGESLLPTGGPGGVAHPTDVPWRPSSGALAQRAAVGQGPSRDVHDCIRWLQRYLPRHAQVHPSGCRRARHAPQKSLTGRLAGGALSCALCSKLSRSAVACAPVPFSSARLGTRLQRKYTSTSFLLGMVRLF